MNEGINGVLGHLYAHIGSTVPGERYEDGEMNEMTLSRHSTQIRSCRTRCLSVTKASHNIKYLQVNEEEISLF